MLRFYRSVMVAETYYEFIYILHCQTIQKHTFYTNLLCTWIPKSFCSF